MQLPLTLGKRLLERSAKKAMLPSATSKQRSGVPGKLNRYPAASHKLRKIHDLHDGRVIPPQQAAIMMYSNRTIDNVSKARSLAFFIHKARRRRLDCFLK